MPIVFDFDFDTSLGGDSHCPECLLPSSCCGCPSLSPSFSRNCCVAPVWCFEPRVATLSVCECERAVDRSTTIEVIVSEILGFFSKLSEREEGCEGRTQGEIDLGSLYVRGYHNYHLAWPRSVLKLLTALRCNLYAQIADKKSKDEKQSSISKTEATTTTMDTNEVVEKVLELLMNLSQLD